MRQNLDLVLTGIFMYSSEQNILLLYYRNINGTSDHHNDPLQNFESKFHHE